MRHVLAATVGALVLSTTAGHAGVGARVATVSDGDTITLMSGARVRLVQIDTPELGSGECYSRKAAAELRRLLAPRTAVRLEADVRLDGTDRYGRLLRYVHARGTNVNVALVRRGAATVWFYDGERGKYAASLLAAARKARAERRGLWGACKTVWDPDRPATTAPKGGATTRSECDPSYPDVCIPAYDRVGDLDCADVSARAFRVVGRDPHGFDGDGDGVGCEQ